METPILKFQSYCTTAGFLISVYMSPECLTFLFNVLRTSYTSLQTVTYIPLSLQWSTIFCGIVNKLEMKICYFVSNTSVGTIWSRWNSKEPICEIILPWRRDVTTTKTSRRLQEQDNFNVMSMPIVLSMVNVFHWTSSQLYVNKIASALWNCVVNKRYSVVNKCTLLSINSCGQ